MTELDDIIGTSGDPPSGASVGGLVSVLKDRAPRLAIAYAGYQAARPLIKRAQMWQKERTTYSISIEGEDEIYDDLHEWLLKQLPSEARRSLAAYSGRVNVRRGRARDVFDDDDDEYTAPEVKLRYDGTRSQTIKLNGHRVKVVANSGETVRENGVSFQVKPPAIYFIVRSTEARDAVQAKMNELLRLRYVKTRRPSLRIARKWGEWNRHNELPLRSLESVVLPATQREALVADMEQFLAAEKAYNRRYIGWHRGYLFEGPPGTGKTSIAKALANHFDMDVWYLPLSDINSGSSLMALVAAVTSRSLLLIEDIDVFHAAKARDDDNEVTLSDLLNALDGITTPHGLITVMTTNDMSVLDDALIRPGRVDRIEHFDLAGQAQVEEIYCWFFERPWPASMRIKHPLAPAEAIGVMHRLVEEPLVAAQVISTMTTHNTTNEGATT